MKRTKVRIQYIVTDWIMANVVWFLFNVSRFEVAYLYSGFSSFKSFMLHPNILMGQLIVPFFLSFLFWLSGYYNKVIRRSRVDELVTTFFSVVFSTLILFILIAFDDFYNNSSVSLFYFCTLFIFLFIGIYIPRLLITQSISNKIHNRSLSFRTLMVGTGRNACVSIQKMNKMNLSLGYEIIGMVEVLNEKTNEPTEAPVLGTLENLKQIISEHRIESVIVAIDTTDKERRLEILSPLCSLPIPVYNVAERYDLLTGKVKEHIIYSTVPLISLNDERISDFEHNLKLVFSWLFSLVAFVVLIPIYIGIAVAIRMESNGPILYFQERLGYQQRKFQIIKFRTMRPNAENGTPMLSTPSDERVTKIGRFLRKYRLDELPQFWNVIKGDMVLVGPRPEREYFARQMIERAPYYALTQRVKPGITSWGMVKFGYASTLDEMIERLEYDLLYIENNSFLVDLRIIIYTVIIIFKGRGL